MHDGRQATPTAPHGIASNTQHGLRHPGVLCWLVIPCAGAPLG
jgi:hypothetical protein